VPARLSVVIVTWNEADTIARCLPPLVEQLGGGDELIVSDNASQDETLEVVARLAPRAVIVQNGGNVGFPAACNSGAAAASGDVLVLLNPDTVVAPGWADAMRSPSGDWDAWQALVTMDGGTRINTSGGVTHFTGIAWAGQMGEPIAAAPAEPREIAFGSGACLALPLATWNELGGMPEHFFLYYDDVDISHLIRTYPPLLLALLMPGLLLTELGILAAAAGGGWAGEKAAAIVDVARNLPLYVRERRAIQATRTIADADFARWLTPELSSPYLGAASRLAPLQWALRAYWRLVRALLP